MTYIDNNNINGGCGMYWDWDPSLNVGIEVIGSSAEFVGEI
jgi:hypothetical protein